MHTSEPRFIERPKTAANFPEIQLRNDALQNFNNLSGAYPLSSSGASYSLHQKSSDGRYKQVRF